MGNIIRGDILEDKQRKWTWSLAVRKEETIYLGSQPIKARRKDISPKELKYDDLHRLSTGRSFLPYGEVTPRCTHIAICNQNSFTISMKMGNIRRFHPFD